MRVRALLAALLIVVVLAAAPAPADAGRADPCTGRQRQACEIPEVPWALILPAVGATLVVGYVLVQRAIDRRRPEAFTDAE